MYEQRSTDRWITPGVVIVGLLVAGALVALLIAAVAWLTVQGLDPDPMLKLIAAAVAAIGTLGNLGLNLATRASVGKTERNTGVLMNHTGELTNAVYEVHDALPRPVVLPRHAADDTAQLDMSAAPGPRGS